MTAWRTSAVGAILLIAFTASAFAKPAKKIHHQQIASVECFTDEDRRGARMVCGTRQDSQAVAQRVDRQRPQKAARTATPAPAPSYGGYGIVSKARAYIGMTAAQVGLHRRTLWCGEFMARVAPAAAARVRNPNMARDYLALPRVGKAVGAIAVLSRGKRGGHVGVVSGITPSGDPIIVSGNHNNRVREAVYPSHRVIAYVSPS